MIAYLRHNALFRKSAGGEPLVVLSGGCSRECSQYEHSRETFV